MTFLIHSIEASEVWGLIRNFIPYFAGHVITCPCWYQSGSMLMISLLTDIESAVLDHHRHPVGIAVIMYTRTCTCYMYVFNAGGERLSPRGFQNFLKGKYYAYTHISLIFIHEDSTDIQLCFRKRLSVEQITNYFLRLMLIYAIYI